jgi:hypothetical protein
MEDTGFPDDGSGIPIANSALTLVGTRLISTVNDASKECTLVSQNWDTYRKAVLRDGLWTFAKEMVVLQADSPFTPKFGYTTRYALPDNYIRLVQFNNYKGDSDGDGAPYRLMNGFIYTNMGYANLTYISDVTDVTMFDPLFCEALSTYIAAKLCNTLTGSSNSAELLEKAYKVAMQKARFVDSVEDPSVQLDSDVWLQSRVGAPGQFRDPQFATDPSLQFPNQPGDDQ